MVEREITVETPDGPMKVAVVQPDGDGPFPVVLQLMDAGGLRDELKEMARRYSEVGVLVATPDFYHHFGEGITYEASKVFGPEGEDLRNEMFGRMAKLSDDMMVADMRATLDHLASDDAAADGAKGCVGYCLGGRAAVRAMAAFADEMTAGSALHPSQLLREADSPYLDIGKSKGEWYFGFGSADDLTPPEVIEAVKAQLAEAGLENTVDVTEGAEHGFTMKGWSARYHAEADRLHWERTLDLFKRRLLT
jgi:carboxymethylenebutenolidase